MPTAAVLGKVEQTVDVANGNESAILELAGEHGMEGLVVLLTRETTSTVTGGGLQLELQSAGGVDAMSDSVLSNESASPSRQTSCLA